MIALITPTGARPQQFNLCAVWMKKQTYTDEVVWVIVDDAHPKSTNQIGEGFRDKWWIVKVYPTPLWSGQNTQSRNIKAGIDALTANFNKKDIKAIFIIEDDDYYRPVYLERMMNQFDQTWSKHKREWIIGETNTVYYNVFNRRYSDNNNKAHASLFQTAFTIDALPILETCYNNRFIDIILWNLVPNKELFFDSYLSIGIKGMPGRKGIGAGHSNNYRMLGDPSMNYLRSIIGDDSRFYEIYYGQTQSQLFTRL
jgi:hypothetical protein